ncbi:MAG: ABC transporter permease [Chloroherpetonaceae bacterium]|nr:ABC transporter permease [Chthonomonadaceae bacterium]MDW8206810.1 ABC transporter permease [Chloroherpetonaceae bacterium]
MAVLEGTLQTTATMATPLLLAALGENVSQRAGVVNVGLEGMMLIGAFTATLATLATGTALAGVGMAALAGVLIALLFALFAVKLTANQVVVGVVINLLALGLTGTVYRARFGQTGTSLVTAKLPVIGANLTVLTPAALVAAFGLWWWLYRTRPGLELRACGEYPAAADAAGVSVGRVRTLAILFCGMMAGIAGAFLSVGEVNTFIENMTDGRGFIALAIVTSGRWNPLGCLIASLVFGFAQALQFQGQALGLQLPYQFFVALPYAVTLCVLMMGGRWSQAPAALGRPYRKA